MLITDIVKIKRLKECPPFGGLELITFCSVDRQRIAKLLWLDK